MKKVSMVIVCLFFQLCKGWENKDLLSINWDHFDSDIYPNSPFCDFTNEEREVKELLFQDYRRDKEIFSQEFESSECLRCNAPSVIVGVLIKRLNESGNTLSRTRRIIELMINGSLVLPNKISFDDQKQAKYLTKCKFFFNRMIPRQNTGIESLERAGSVALPSDCYFISSPQRNFLQLPSATASPCKSERVLQDLNLFTNTVFVGEDLPILDDCQKKDSKGGSYLLQGLCSEKTEPNAVSPLTPLTGCRDGDLPEVYGDDI